MTMEEKTMMTIKKEAMMIMHEGEPFISYLLVSNSSLALLRSNSPRTTDRSSFVDSVEPSLWDLYFFFFSIECQSWHLKVSSINIRSMQMRGIFLTLTSRNEQQLQSIGSQPMLLHILLLIRIRFDRFSKMIQLW